MKREIKFRAWDNQENRMITNGCLGAGSSCQIIIIELAGGLSLCNAYGLPDGTNPTFDKPVTERFEIMQYTGIKDRNGKEIFEGDIFKIGAEKEIFDVRFEHGCFMAFCDGKQAGLVGELQMCFINVIGNIFENPELLEAVA